MHSKAVVRAASMNRQFDTVRMPWTKLFTTIQAHGPATNATASTQQIDRISPSIRTATFCECAWSVTYSFSLCAGLKRNGSVEQVLSEGESHAQYLSATCAVPKLFYYYLIGTFRRKCKDKQTRSELTEICETPKWLRCVVRIPCAHTHTHFAS